MYDAKSEPGLVAQSDLGETPVAEATKPKVPDRTLVLIGFTARGNAGDEALLQCIYEAFRDTFRVVISVDEHGASDRFWEWYPYNECKIVHRTNIGFLDGLSRRDCVLVGGGGLSVGYGAEQVLYAKSKGMKAALVGTDVPRRVVEKSNPLQAAYRSYAGLFDLVAPRTETSTQRAEAAGISVLHGADWALRLEADQSEDIRPDPKRAIVVLREFPPGLHRPGYWAEVYALLACLGRTGWTPILLPFSPEDEALTAAMGAGGEKVERHVGWWNPRRLKQMIAGSGLVVSVGRLHPGIFAATTDCAILMTEPPTLSDDGHFGLKVREICLEYGIAYFEDMASVLRVITEGKTVPADRAKVVAARARLDGVIEKLRAVFDAGK